MSGLDPAASATLRLALALLFAAAAWHKLRDPRGFRATLGDYRLLPDALVAPVSVLLPAGEAVLAAGLLGTATAPGAAALAACLLSVYGAAIAWNLARGRRHVACGCLGPAADQPLHGALVLRNALLAAAAALAAAPVGARATGALDALTVGGGVATAALLYLAVDGLLAAARASEVRP